MCCLHILSLSLSFHILSFFFCSYRIFFKGSASKGDHGTYLIISTNERSKFVIYKIIFKKQSKRKVNRRRAKQNEMYKKKYMEKQIEIMDPGETNKIIWKSINLFYLKSSFRMASGVVCIWDGVFNIANLDCNMQTILCHWMTHVQLSVKNCTAPGSFG